MAEPESKKSSIIRRAGQLLRVAGDGAPDVVEQILDLYRPLLLSIANDEIDSFLRPKAGASDVVQETLLEAYNDFASFKGSDPEQLLNWLRKLLQNNIADLYRRYRRSKKRQVGRERPLASSDVRRLLDQLSVRRHSEPGSELELRDNRRMVREAVDQLDRGYRQVILWRFRDGLDFAEIGRKIDRSADAARMLCNRALKRLAFILRREP